MAVSDRNDMLLAENCVRAYAESTGLGCTLTDTEGKVICEYGYGCAGCRICSIAGIDRKRAEAAHMYGMNEAARFGGKYIYFCPMGFACFVAPLASSKKQLMRATVGPFLMVSQEDYIVCDLEEKLNLNEHVKQQVIRSLDSIPFVEPRRVKSLSDLLFYSINFVADRDAADSLLGKQSAEAIQESLSGYITEFKGSNLSPDYPLVTEKQLTAAIANADKTEAGRLLNELLGYIFFASGGEFSRIKTRAHELIVLISRAAADGGADARQIFELNECFYTEIVNIDNIEDLCFWLTGVMNTYLSSVFDYIEVRHYDVIHKAVAYIRSHITERISLEDVAKEVYLTPSYLSRMFKKEMGCNFSRYLNKLRVERSKPFLLNENNRLIDIAQLSGFEDQSYFTKVFKKITGVTPSRYRELKGRVSSKTREENHEIHSR